jgi:leader peptidase (prepilin peptidase)/N-methyltransferase
MNRLQLLEFLIHAMAFLMGAGIGSFLNVVIYRLPLGISVNNPRRSFCPLCKKQIPWYRNLPLITWLAQRGKCAECGSSIPFRYFFVELLTACIFYAIFYKFHGPWEFISQWGPLVLCYWVFAALLIAGTYIDIDHLILPHVITIGGFFAGLVGSFLVPQLMEEKTGLRGITISFVSACIGLGLLWTIVELGKMAFGRIKRVFEKPEQWSISQANENEPPLLKVADLELTWDDIFGRASDKLIIDTSELTINERNFANAQIEVRVDKLRVTVPGSAVETVDLEGVKKLLGKATKLVIPREAMGFGDVLLLAMIGSFLGWKAVLFTIVAGSFLGSAFAVVPRLIGKTEWTAKIPFGPYLAAGGMIWLFYGTQFLEWYLGRMHFGGE